MCLIKVPERQFKGVSASKGRSLWCPFFSASLLGRHAAIYHWKGQLLRRQEKNSKVR